MIESFLSRRGKDLEGFEFLYGKDNNQNPASEWGESSKKILLVFLSTGPTRSVSNTFTVLNNIIKTRFGSDCFVDYSYLPSKDDIKVFRDERMSFLFGNVSHKFWYEYDMVALCMSILPELYNIPAVLRFNNIPLGYNERMSRPDVPYIIAGGVCSPMADIIYGKVSETDHCMVDGVYVGHAEEHFCDVIESLLSPDFSKRESLKTVARNVPCFYVPAE